VTITDDPHAAAERALALAEADLAAAYERGADAIEIDQLTSAMISARQALRVPAA